jgi:hypothetical protein
MDEGEARERCTELNDWFWIFFLKTESYYVVTPGLKLMSILPELPKCWGYRCVPPQPTEFLFQTFLERLLCHELL